ncbi:unnamed protein product [Phyllotreta striolata]|uniref:Lipase domain-containing protein n=1 Tax=Phyllotreta striolata TaxID=444603 RepID=A0A9N9XWK1_PHYSR|nr:unnamed protein product [Phyllotreta striolata]
MSTTSASNRKLGVLLIFAACLSTCYCVITVEQVKNYYRSLPRVNFSLANGEKTDVIYKLFTDISQTTGKVITTENANEEIVNKTLPTVLLIHGFTTDDTSPWYNPLKTEYFKLGPHNIIYINWSKAGNRTYTVSSANVKPIGKYIAEFLVESKVDLKKVHLIGHSLGSQLASFIGKYVKKLSGTKVGRITGLDPANPCFANPEMSVDERLNPEDAEFVDVIHTDVQLFGYAAPIGHVDFYPNGGGHQPGCPTREIDDNCSHARSTLYFIESLSVKQLVAEATFKEEGNVVTVSIKGYQNNVIFGQHVDVNARGVYSFKTGSVKPYLTSIL